MSRRYYPHSNNNLSYGFRTLRDAIRLLLSAAVLGALGIPLTAQDEIPVVESPSKRIVRPPQVTPATQLQGLQQEYIISPDDDLEIYVLDVAELSRQYRVSPTGVIDLPLLPKPITAVGLTPEQLSQVITEQLQTTGMVDQPHVTVRVKESRLHSVAVAGAVKKPQIYQIFGKTTLLDALSQAEGLDQEAGSNAIITRGDLGSRMSMAQQTTGPKVGGRVQDSRSVSVDLKALLEEGDSSQNLDLYPGDRVTVQRAGIVYVVGAVNRAGGFVLDKDREQMTVLKAIALANNVSPVAATKSAVIIRGGTKAGVGSQEIPVELDKILKHRAKDRILLANDILFVPESSGKKATMRASEAAAQAAVVAVWRF